MMQHIRHLEENLRCRAAHHQLSAHRAGGGFNASLAPPHAVSDADFIKMIAIMRLAVPYTGMIMSTREGRSVRRQTFAVGISQISAGSRCDPGGYKDGEGDPNGSQFQLGDHRTVEEVVSATWFRWATRLRSAPPAIDWGAPGRTLWTWPSRARSSTTASPMRSRRFSSICATTPGQGEDGWRKTDLD
jgi:hypothetical protein